MKISKYFDLSEFCHSNTAQNLQIMNIPGDTEIEALENLAKALLDPLRALYGKALYVNSGYRCPELNKAVGGVPTSQHQRGEAADIRCGSPKDLLAILKKSKLDFDQAILYPTFLHLSLKKTGKNRCQIITK